MAIALQSAGHHHAIHPLFEGVEDLRHLHPSRTRHFDDAYVGRVLDAHAPRQIGRSVGTVPAAESSLRAPPGRARDPTAWRGTRLDSCVDLPPGETEKHTAQTGFANPNLFDIEASILEAGGEGREIVETIGIVRGNAARARGIGYDITAGIRNIFGGAVPDYSNLMTQSRDEATQRMIEAADSVDFDAYLAAWFADAEAAGTPERA